jgi:hypothetical protein
MLGEKIVRGMLFRLEGRYIDSAKESVGVYFLEDAKATFFVEILRKSGEEFHRGQASR